jgi:hypothetical protein
MFKCLEKFFESIKLIPHSKVKYKSQYECGQENSIKDSIIRVFRMTPASHEELKNLDKYKYVHVDNVLTESLKLTIDSVVLEIGVSTIFIPNWGAVKSVEKLSVNECNIDLYSLNDLSDDGRIVLKDLLNEAYDLVSKDIKEVRKNNEIEKNKKISEMNYFLENIKGEYES